MVLAAIHCHLAGRYRLCRWLAAGGMGQVWQAVDEVLGRPVAVKSLRDEYAQDPRFVRRLRAEARILHDQVVQVAVGAAVETVTMLGWLRAAAARASRPNRATSSRSWVAATLSTLIATVRSSTGHGPGTPDPCPRPPVAHRGHSGQPAPVPAGPSPTTVVGRRRPRPCHWEVAAGMAGWSAGQAPNPSADLARAGTAPGRRR